DVVDVAVAVVIDPVGEGHDEVLGVDHAVAVRIGDSRVRSPVGRVHQPVTVRVVGRTVLRGHRVAGDGGAGNGSLVPVDVDVGDELRGVGVPPVDPGLDVGPENVGIAPGVCAPGRFEVHPAGPRLGDLAAVRGGRGGSR